MFTMSIRNIEYNLFYKKVVSMKTLLEHAILLANKGYYIFPLSPNAKVPIAGIKWREESTTYLPTIKAWWEKNPNYNIGIDTGKSSVYVIDVDVKKGKRGAESFDNLDMLYGFPDTLTAITASGGRHHIYKSPDEPLRNTDSDTNGLGGGLDTRGWGGFIVGAGSVIDGKPYYFDEATPMTPSPLPDWINEMLISHRLARKQNNRDDVLTEDKQGDKERAKHWLLNDAELAVENHSGDATTYKVAAKLREFGLSADTVLDLMAENWNGRCSPPWSIDDLQKKVENAYKYATNAQGADSPYAEFQAIPHIVDYASFAPDFFIPDTVAKRDWVFDDLALAKNVTVLTAPPGVGKSTFTIGIAISKATGKNIMGFNPRGAGNVLLLNNEDDMQELTRRTKAICQHYSVTNEDLYENDAMGASARSKLMMQSGENRQLMIAQRANNVLKPKDVDDLIATIITRNIKLLIIDPFSETHPANENDNGEIGLVARMYREVAQKAGCAIILVHHDRKPDKADSTGHVGNMYAARGASSLAGVARIMFTFYTMSEKDCKKYGIAEDEKRYYVRLDNAKANMTLSGGEPRWFKRIGEILGAIAGDPDSGESVGILAPIKLTSKKVAEGSVGFDLVKDIESLVVDSGATGMSLTAIVETLIRDFSSHNGKTKEGLKKAIQRMFDDASELPASGGFITLFEQSQNSPRSNKYFIKWTKSTQ